MWILERKRGETASDCLKPPVVLTHPELYRGWVGFSLDNTGVGAVTMSIMGESLLGVPLAPTLAVARSRVALHLAAFLVTTARGHLRGVPDGDQNAPHGLDNGTHRQVPPFAVVSLGLEGRLVLGVGEPGLLIGPITAAILLATQTIEGITDKVEAAHILAVGEIAIDPDRKASVVCAGLTGSGDLAFVMEAGVGVLVIRRATTMLGATL